MTLLKKLILIKEVHQQSAIFTTICISLDKGSKFHLCVCNGSHDLLMSINFNDIAIDYCCNINGISKSDAVNLLENADLTKKVYNYKK